MGAASAPQQAIHATAWRRIEAAAASSCGTRHEHNEDAHSALSRPGHLFVVADGVGGGAMARLASQRLVVRLHAALDGRAIDAAQVREAVLDADNHIARHIAHLTDAPGAATLALCAPVNATASKWLVAWVGDCRVYRLRRRGEPGLELLTQDDTFAYLQETPPAGSSPGDPARMVGNGAVAVANVATHRLRCGDLLVLCSDGVHKYVDDNDLREILARPLPLAQRCEALVSRARAQGSSDDATVLLLRRNGPWWRLRRLTDWFASGSSPLRSSR